MENGHNLSQSREQTHQTRQPSRAAVSIESGLSRAYAMAGLSNSGMDLDGQRQLAGLSIYRRGRRNKVSNAPPAIRTNTSHSHKGAPTIHQDQPISPISLAAISASAARQVRRSQFNGLSPREL